ncbi:MAG: RluA family pseudouridine synthase [Aquificota bacterium]|nr:MAG: RluA family pseudouridine synthase [Aquificota bacterium]
MTEDIRRFVVEEGDAGVRLDRFLETRLEGFTRSRIKGLIEEGLVKVGGVQAKKGGQKVKGGDVIEVTIPPPKTLELVPLSMELPIFYEDEHLLVLDKPAGLVVHPAPGHENDTLVNALLAHCGDLKGIGGVERPGIVHRLDKDTSGLLVVAKDEATHQALVDQFQSQQVEKVYLALVYGCPRLLEGTIRTCLARHPIHRKKMAVVEEGKEAVTHYRVLASGSGLSLVEVKIETGRTHQIRVHMHYIGHPIVGDPVYGGRMPRDLSPSLKEVIKAMGRQALHHHRMRFVHPVTGEGMTFASPLPEDISNVLREAGLEAG